jgi:hypothetical protein
MQRHQDRVVAGADFTASAHQQAPRVLSRMEQFAQPLKAYKQHRP